MVKLNGKIEYPFTSILTHWCMAKYTLDVHLKLYLDVHLELYLEEECI